ncbi:aladin [Vigna radiata var. radiata]|uniref:Aladin n=1 Tax=Vigna radiata var. radiata TaxID=3916 RepID=A0A1S3TBZ1_VIGRR|nr:aladin [Vigna radiata var. radiata]
MASFPPPGSLTLCELNRDLITVNALSDDQANQTYGKILGSVFSPVPFHSLESEASDQEGATTTANAAGENVQRKGPVALLQGLVNTYLGRLFYPNDVHLLPEVDLQGVSWHPNKHIIAFISAPTQVLVRDYQESEGKDPSILANESQRDVRVLEWRPNGGKMLAVGCKGGICIWAASYPGNAASVRSGAASFLGSLSRSSGNRYILVDFLRSPYDEHVSALTWRPDGRYLASGSYESSSFTVWDFAQGVGTPIRRGLGGISMLKWSPTGDYFFASKFDGTFYLWETNTWTSEQWSSTSGFVKGATWDPDGRMILLAFSESSTLGSVHFASKPPSLDAHLLPVDLPEILSLTGSQGIEKIAWDNSGERLAISFKGGDDVYRGLIAIYDTRRTPLISTSLIGFIRGPGDSPKPITFSFHGKFKQGPLLSVCWSSGFCCTYPLLFRPHTLP